MSKNLEAERVSFIKFPSIWEEMNGFVRQYNAINLGQGFPSFNPPTFVIDTLHSLLNDNNCLNHQYSPSYGNMELIKELREEYSSILNRSIKCENIIVTVGASQALSAIFNSLVSAHDEVVLFEPFYDVYKADALLCHCTVKLVPIMPCGECANDWTFDASALSSAVSEKTKLIVLNTPQNVPGKVWSVHELEHIANVAKANDAIVVADEVYMHLTYDGKHTSIATLPNMFERTITVGSAGKTFSMTGWKIGWAIAPENIIKSIAKTVSYQTFCCATPLQITVARSLAIARNNNYYTELREMYKKKVDYLIKIIEESGLTPIRPSGGFFVLADISCMDEELYYNDQDKDHAKDWQFCVWLMKVCGVGAIPVTAFCDREHWPTYEKYIRFASCKPDEELKKAAVQLMKLREYLN